MSFYPIFKRSQLKKHRDNKKEPSPFHNKKVTMNGKPYVRKPALPGNFMAMFKDCIFRVHGVESEIVCTDTDVGLDIESEGAVVLTMMYGPANGWWWHITNAITNNYTAKFTKRKTIRVWNK